MASRNWLAEQLVVLSFARNSGFPATSLRLFSVYGERERPDKLFPILIRSILLNKPFTLREGSLSHFGSFTNVHDAVSGLISAMDNVSKARGEIFNIGSDVRIATSEGIQIVEGILQQKAKMQITPGRLGDQIDTCANIEKARSLLGYNPRVNYEQGLKMEVYWFKSYLSLYF